MLWLQGYAGLTALPERIGDCVALTTLSLSGCAGLTALPERLGDCAALETLWLQDCSHLTCTALPERLDDCSSLSLLRLQGRICLPIRLHVAERLPVKRKARGCIVHRLLSYTVR